MNKIFPSKLEQLPEEHLLKNIQEDSIEDILAKQKVSKVYTLAVIHAQLREGDNIALTVCIENLKAHDLPEEHRLRIFKDIDQRLKRLMNEMVIAMHGLDWEVLRKILFIF